MKNKSFLASVVAALAIVIGGAHALAAGGGGACTGTGQWEPDSQGNPVPTTVHCFGDCPLLLPVGAECQLVVRSQSGATAVSTCGCTNLPSGGSSTQFDTIDPDGPGPLKPQIACDMIIIVDHSQNPSVVTFQGCSGLCSPASLNCTESILFNENGHKLSSCRCQ